MAKVQYKREELKTNMDEIQRAEPIEDDIKRERLQSSTPRNDELSYIYFIKPEDMGINIKKFIFNRQEKSVLGRTKERWGICALFYAVFYSSLAAFWSLCLYIALNVITSKEGPTILAGEMKMLGPGLAHYPTTRLINFTQDDAEYIKSLDAVLNRFPKEKANDYVDCQTTPSSPEKCFFDVTALGDCAPGGTYGYESLMPCIILKLNRAFGWKPELYNEMDGLPELMPDSMKDYISKQKSEKMNRIWVSCEGYKEKDKDLLKRISFWPEQGFPSYFYPFHGEKKHLSPLVAIQLESKKRDVEIIIHCQAWAKNLRSDEIYGSFTMFKIFFN